MLSTLSIRNIVLIAQADLAFGAGLSVLTGETGAGKSILLDALGLALGARAEGRLIRSGADAASVTAVFENPPAEAATILEELGIEPEDSLVLRRTLKSDGSSRAFVNDSPVNASTLKRLGALLLEVHGQQDQQGLLDVATHAPALDAFGGLLKERAAVAQAFNAWQAAKTTHAELLESIASAKREEEFLQHMHDELSKLKPAAGEEEQLAARRTQMMQSEKIASLLQEMEAMLTGSDMAPLATIRSAQRTLARSSLGSPDQFDPLIDALEAGIEAMAQAEDRLEELKAQCEYQPSELERIEERLFALRGAARKYQTTCDGLGELFEDTKQKLATLKSQDKALAAAEARLNETRKSFVAAADTLNAAREKITKKLSTAIEKELKPLKMESARFEISREVLPESAWHSGGTEAVRFTIATNAGSTAGPLNKIASGGELSRIMLALKVVLAATRSAPTLIFDEIDAGTGGATADAIGERLARLGQTHQVMVVTHLPQVAAKGSTHFSISKSSDKKQTTTQVVPLDKKSREEELARMLAGAKITKEARDVASQLLEASA